MLDISLDNFDTETTKSRSMWSVMINFLL